MLEFSCTNYIPLFYFDCLCFQEGPCTPQQRARIGLTTILLSDFEYGILYLRWKDFVVPMIPLFYFDSIFFVFSRRPLYISHRGIRIALITVIRFWILLPMSQMKRFSIIPEYVCVLNLKFILLKGCSCLCMWIEQMHGILPFTIFS